MKKTVLTFGIISGVVATVLMWSTMLIMDRVGFDRGYLLGYTGIVLSFLLVFFGIRSYRENVGAGSITFGRAFAVGILITVISSVMYVISWEILYHTFMSDFLTKFTAYSLDKLKASGATPEVIAQKTKEMDQMKAIFANPIYRYLMVFIEPFPVGLLITLISSAILRKSPSGSVAPTTTARMASQ